MIHLQRPKGSGIINNGKEGLMATLFSTLLFMGLAALLNGLFEDSIDSAIDSAFEMASEGTMEWLRDLWRSKRSLHT